MQLVFICLYGICILLSILSYLINYSDIQSFCFLITIVSPRLNLNKTMTINVVRDNYAIVEKIDLYQLQVPITNPAPLILHEKILSAAIILYWQLSNTSTSVKNKNQKIVENHNPNLDTVYTCIKNCVELKKNNKHKLFK